MSIESRSQQYGKVFDHWQIKEFLGSGSGGKTAVFRLVRSDSTRGVSALKVVNLIEVRGDINNLSEFRRKEYETARDECSRNAEQEVWLMDDLRGNTNIVDYLDHTFVDWSDETGFGRDLLIRMELLKDLRSELQKGRIFSELEALKIGRDICIALILCHRKNILHRDVKPENIFRNKDGNYKLGDFGVSRVLDACPGAVASTGIGTYEYWPAEQMTGRYDKRVDVYSLGLVLYELCNQNRLPFAVTSFATSKEVSMRLAGTPLPEPSQASPMLAQVILKACAFDPDERYQSAEELLKALNRAIRSLQGSVEKKTAVLPQKKEQPKAEYATVAAEAPNAEVPANDYKTTPANADVQRKKSSFSTEPAEKYVPQYATKLPLNKKKNHTTKIWLAIALLGLFMMVFSVGFLFADSRGEQAFGEKDTSLHSNLTGETLKPLIESTVEETIGIFLGNNIYPIDATTIELTSLNENELSELKRMKKLQTVVVSGDGDNRTLQELQKYCNNSKITFQIRIADQIVADNVEKLSITGITDEEIELLRFFSELRTLNMKDPSASPEKIFALKDENPEITVSWEVEIRGHSFDNTATEVDLSNVVIEDLSEVESRAAYLPNLEKLILGVCGIDNPDWGNSKSELAACAIGNEDMSAYRDRVRDQYKVVWTVRLGPDIALRTDKDNFMPNHFGVGRLPDSYAYNLRYCEDMVCLDVGHMTLTDISFVKYMPNLKYLILAWTEVQYIEPIRNCKNLIYLELDNSAIQDYTPLVECTALQDLNIGNTSCDIEPVLKMTWLKNLYMIFGGGSNPWTAVHALPDTNVVVSGNSTVGGGWRRLQNYYDMRDYLGLPYMN